MNNFSADFLAKSEQHRKMLIYSANKETRRYNYLLKQFDINNQAFQVLDTLLDYPDGIEPSNVAKKLFVPRQSMTSIADILEKKGYIERAKSPTDRRSILLKLLPAGKDAAVSMRRAIKEFHDEVFSQFSEEELSTYFDMWAKISATFDKKFNDQFE